MTSNSLPDAASDASQDAAPNGAPAVNTPLPPAAPQWRQGELIDLTISDLNHNGEGVGRWDGRVVFVGDTAVGDRILARLVRVKPTYAYAKLFDVLDASPQRVRPRCIVADKCGGCQWQHVDYAFQQTVKRNLVVQDLERIGGFSHPPVDPLLPVAHPLAYRNKATYPLGRSPQGQVQAGYYQKGSHSLINLNQCPIQDQRLNPLLADIKHDLQTRGWSIYKESEHRGKLKYLSLRIGQRTGEQLLTLVSTGGGLEGLTEQAEAWMARYPDLVGVLLNLNPKRGNAIFGSETQLVAGQGYLREEFAGLEFRIHPTTFFQVNTEQAEALLNVIEAELNLTGTETVLDAYAGIGTLTLPLAKRAKEAIALEVQPEAVVQAKINAEINHIENVAFHTGAVETLLPTLEVHPDVVVLDPPRKGCDPAVLQTLLLTQPERIVYMSCNPSTLARDLKILCAEGHYQLTRVQPADFFPQTAHVECAAFLVRL
ncbi:23S rRNA (uracil(1939)-C(5))-methyltransferase RlmD [Leptolyngbya sp. AN02str]|uniref:23S rRNA (uracil(1939)-C(5))-methyltransferase RlmD n=1 Tax=Leptolyngbya sp. AN02str TaxID=3423363 RepID=UPI003D31A739